MRALFPRSALGLSRPACLPAWSGVFPARARSLSESGRLAASSMPSVRQRSEAVDVDCGQLVWRGLKDVAIVMDMHEFAPVGGRATSG
jgi:hypothetical protein